MVRAGNSKGLGRARRTGSQEWYPSSTGAATNPPWHLEPAFLLCKIRCCLIFVVTSMCSVLSAKHFVINSLHSPVRYDLDIEKMDNVLALTGLVMFEAGAHTHSPVPGAVLPSALPCCLLGAVQSWTPLALIPYRPSPKVPKGLLNLDKEQRILSATAIMATWGPYDSIPSLFSPTRQPGIPHH